MEICYEDGAGQASVDFQIELDFDLSSLGISGSDIINISVDVRSCWTGGTGLDCGVNDNPEFDAGTNGEFRVWLEGADTG